MHLDGLADTVDGLGSGKPADEALAIMRKSDIGPFGVVALALTLLVQVVALAALLTIGRGLFAVACALVVSRFVLPVVCSRGVPAARSGGLGQAVAGTVGRSQLLLSAAFTAAGLLVFAVVDPGPDADFVRAAVVSAVAAVVALAAGTLVCRRCVHRLGGITGDVLGACIEVTFTTVLVVLTMV
jgi:adenosylcobinamide-GDP ribazoletransferase